MAFHAELLAMSQEVRFWELLRMNIPYVAMEIQAQRDKYRVLREHALALVRDYNKVSGLAGRSSLRSGCRRALPPQMRLLL